MVVFTCNSCGDSLKKNKVDNHRYQCRMGSLSCVDCLKDFSLQTYSEHIECITEDQKYGGLNFKQQEFKGKAKQNDWMQKIKDVINSNQHTGHMQNLLQRLLNYDNIPRKKAKFGNFVKNSFGLRNEKIVNDIWEIFEKATKSDNPQQQQQNGAQNNNNNNKQTPNNNINQQNGSKRPLNGDSHSNEEGDNNNKKTKVENGQPSAEESNGGESQLKMKDVIGKYLKESNNELAMAKLKKKVLKLYVENGYEDEESVEESFNKVVKKRFSVSDSNVVTLKC